ncbi:MAG: FAD-binding oxidoreductase [Actinomycetes bacterium]
MDADVIAKLLADLAQVVGAGQVLTDPQLTARYTADWMGRPSGPARAVVRPANTAEVSAVLAVCAAFGAPVLPQGGITGLVGGSVPAPAAPGTLAPIIVSTLRMDHLGPVDPLTGQVVVGAGATLAVVRAHAAAAGWEYGVDIAARDSATIGGTLATNAGGIRVCAFGMTRAQVAGIEAVLPDGSVISHLQGLPKDNTGYDLAGLLVGSEGTLGVITAATLRLHRPAAETTLALIGVNDYTNALELVARVRAAGPRLLAAEIVDRRGTELVCEVVGLPWPLADRSWPHLLLVEVEGSEMDLPDDADAIMAFDDSDYRRIWAYRERQTEVTSAVAAQHKAFLHKLDVSIPSSAMQDFAADLAVLLSGDATVVDWSVFGHVADGNLHLEIIGPAQSDERVVRSCLELVAEHSGSISAEHGVGRAKAQYLSLTRSAPEIAAMRSIKAALDPQSIMAPGVIFPID